MAKDMYLFANVNFWHFGKLFAIANWNKSTNLHYKAVKQFSHLQMAFLSITSFARVEKLVSSSLRQNASIGVAKMWWWVSRDMILKSLLQTKKVKNNRNSSDHVSKGQIVSAGNWYQRIPYIGQWPKSWNCVRL